MLIQPNYTETALVPYVPPLNDAYSCNKPLRILLEVVADYFRKKRLFYTFSLVLFVFISAFCVSLRGECYPVLENWLASVGERYNALSLSCFFVFACFGYSGATRFMMFLFSFTSLSRIVSAFMLLRLFAFSSALFCASIQMLSSLSFAEASLFVFAFALQIFADVCFSAEAFGFHGTKRTMRRTVVYSIAFVLYSAFTVLALSFCLNILFS